MLPKDTRVNTLSKPYAVIELWNGERHSGTLLEDHGDGTATIKWDRGPWRGKLIRKRDNHPVNDE